MTMADKYRLMGKEIFMVLDGRRLGFTEPPLPEVLQKTLEQQLKPEVLKLWKPNVTGRETYEMEWPLIEAWFELKSPDLLVTLDDVTQLLDNIYTQQIQASHDMYTSPSVIALQNPYSHRLMFITMDGERFEIAQSATIGTGYPDGATRELDAFEGQDLSKLSKKRILEQLLYNSEGVFVDSDAFSFVSEDDFGDLYVSWFTEDGLEYTAKIDMDSLKDAEIISPQSGIIKVKDTNGRDVTLQILTSKDLSAIAALEQFAKQEKKQEQEMSQSYVPTMGPSMSPTPP